MKANLEFNIPDDNEVFECAMYSQQVLQALKNIRAKVSHNLEKEMLIPNQKRQIYAEINNMIIQELSDNGVTHLF